MFLKVAGDSFSEYLAKEIEALTNHGKVSVAKIRFQKKEGTISIPFERYELVPQKPGFLRWGPPYRYEKNSRKKTLAVIKNVVDSKINDLTTDQNVSEIEILFGFRVDGKEIYFCSAEEERGEPLFSMEVRVSSLDLEIRDV